MLALPVAGGAPYAPPPLDQNQNLKNQPSRDAAGGVGGRRGVGAAATAGAHSPALRLGPPALPDKVRAFDGVCFGPAG